MEVTKTVETAVENKGNAMFTHPFSCLHAHTRAHIHAHPCTGVADNLRGRGTFWILFIPGPLVTNVVLLAYQTAAGQPWGSGGTLYALPLPFMA